MSKLNKIVSLALFSFVLFSIGNHVDPVVAEEKQDTTTMPSGTIIRVSVASDGTQGNGNSLSASISSDSRFAAFSSDSTNLVSGDTNGVYDVFLHDTMTQETILVSVSSDGTQGDGPSGFFYIQPYYGLSRSCSYTSISRDGHYVAFLSAASNLVSRDMNYFCDTNQDGVHSENCPDVFLHDTQTGVTTRISVASDGTEANNSSCVSSISADGRYVVFGSKATNLVSGDTNGAEDIFLHNTQTDETTRISVDSYGNQGNYGASDPAISADGRYVAFSSFSNNLVSGDTNNETDIFFHDTHTGETKRISPNIQSDDFRKDPFISENGRFVTFSTGDVTRSVIANFYRGIYVSDTHTGDIYYVDHGYSSTISGDGRYVTFENSDVMCSLGGLGNCTDIALHDRLTGVTSPIVVGREATISTDGRYVVFESSIDYLVSGDTNNKSDIFIRKLMKFSDVPPNYWSFDWVEALFQAGLSSGCSINPPLYCPENPATRAEVAVFLERGIHYPNWYSPPDVAPSFGDTVGHWAEDWIEALCSDGITSGCGDGNYCPDQAATRAQIAVFLLKAKHGAGYTPPPVSGGSFSDVTGHWAEDWIEQLAAEGITSGYPDGTFKPNRIVTRAEMAVFLVKTFNLTAP